MKFNAKIYIARDGNGDLFAYDEPPMRNNDEKIWEATSGGWSDLTGDWWESMFGNLKWEDPYVEYVLANF